MSRNILSKIKTKALKQFGLVEKKILLVDAITQRVECDNKQEPSKNDEVLKKPDIYVE